MTAKSMSARSAARRRHHATPKESFLGRLLDPIDRLAETIFSILILLTFTLAFRIIKLGPDPTQTIYPSYMNDLLIAAAGATLAWGIIDGIMYTLMTLFERGERHRLLRALQTADTDEEGDKSLPMSLISYWNRSPVKISGKCFTWMYSSTCAMVSLS